MIERQNDADDSVKLVITTFPNEEVARQIGTQLVEIQLAACVNLLPGVQSIYCWKGKVEKESEILGYIKTTNSRLEELEKWLQENHPYDEPEFVVVPIEAGSSGYLGWVREQTQVDKSGS